MIGGGIQRRGEPTNEELGCATHGKLPSDCKYYRRGDKETGRVYQEVGYTTTYVEHFLALEHMIAGVGDRETRRNEKRGRRGERESFPKVWLHYRHNTVFLS